jgi:hypothetical protein
MNITKVNKGHGTKAARVKHAFRCKPFNVKGMTDGSRSTGDSLYATEAWTQARHDMLSVAEVRTRMMSCTPKPLDLVMRDCVEMFGNTWIPLDTVVHVAERHGVQLSPFRPWVLYTCARTFRRAQMLHDVPWGFFLPYFEMSPHSEEQECLFRVSRNFLRFAKVTSSL